MKITVIGIGYVGLVTATCLAEMGNQVCCVEKEAGKLEKLKAGIPPIYEPGLPDLLTSNLANQRLTFSTSIGHGVKHSHLIFICVGTPERDNGRLDLSQVEEVARKIAADLTEYRLLVIKSTVPIITQKQITTVIRRHKKKGVPFEVASNPEFLREGSAVYDFMNPDRIVIGVTSTRARKLLGELYAGFNCPKVVTTPIAAELIKHASNSFLALKISYINVVADICEKVGVDIKDVASGMGYDHRIGRDFLETGIGYGGSCLSKDVKTFASVAQGLGIDFKLLRETEAVNQDRAIRFVDKVKKAAGTLSGKTIAVWGLSFKPDTDDIREAPSLKIIPELRKEGAKIKAYDPAATASFRRAFPKNESITYQSDMYQTLAGADALLVLTEWDRFKNADIKHMKSLMKTHVIIDGRNIYPPDTMRGEGFQYYGVGR
ncbi:MAG: UDP-glucose 6-dehydrogenase [Dehalococcoidales bacterium]|jgi:UDPglucose 6-dehydrogenase|nr:UDP-glucose 6-dehydrogenase [Dehalococcoidales bacterium]|tara:strand:- start:28 stop:1326 length:1299 start_codon:yes stop_codon:yes gene_type:complete